MARARTTEVLVIGAGPVGLTAALALAQRGIDTMIVDKNRQPATHSYALVLHPGSLRLLERLGLTADLIAAGRRVDRVIFYNGRSPRAEVSFAAVEGPYPFALVLPQSRLEEALEGRLRALKVRVRWNHEAADLTEDPAKPRVRIDRLEKISSGYPIQRTEWVVGGSFDVQPRFVIGADGYLSFVRTRLGLGMEVFGDPECYEVFEFALEEALPDAVQIAFTDRWRSVLWPMADGRCRWSFQTGSIASQPGSPTRLMHWVEQRAPWFEPRPVELRWAAGVQFEHRLAGRFGAGRYWLAGDAAHLTGPIGGQSMNIGLREAVDLADRLAAILRDGAPEDLLEQYHQQRVQEWRRLLMLDGEPLVQPQAQEWVREHRALIPECLPASGDDLQRLMAQMGLAWA